MNEIEKLKGLIRECTRCKALIRSRRQVVFGYGVFNAEVLIVGEAPSRKGSDIVGVPFTNDRSGSLLREILKKYNFLDNTNLYITNLVKCCPPNNRAPSKTEILNCKCYLDSEISLIQPKVIVPLGNKATSYFIRKKIEMGSYHQKLIIIDKLVLYPMFHPGYVIRGNITRNEYDKGFKQLQKIYSNLA